MTADADPTTEELRLEQLQREQELHRHAEQTPGGGDTDQLDARADKARYLREKLEERAAAERAAD